MSTIAAISTPNAIGGIAVIRISGEGAIEVAEKIFSPFGSKKVSEMEGYTCAYGIAHNGNERLDDCILTVFRAPHSYTGEDIAELSCHGGLYVTRKVLRAALANGAVNAEAGEFTKRAYLNGKLDLTQAEAVMDIISAKGERELKMAESLREGAAFKKAKKCSDKLLKILGDLAAWADYPEEDIPEVRPEVLSEELKGVRDELRSLIANYDSGRILREGVATAIIGRPNVGKSTLFNCLSGCERSIVTEIAGTTRDVIEESVRIGDITLRLSDTAGIHETDDVIEGIGVEMAEKMISKSELVIAVFDGSCPLTEDDLYLINKINKDNTVAVINKNDVEQLLDTSLLEQKIQHIVYLSAKENTGVDELYDKIQTIFKLNEADFDTATAANERQKKCIDKALEGIESTILSLEIGEMLDAVNILVDEAEQSLLMLTGEKVTDAVVDEVFSRFCVGK
ncbi:MAG: tRNA uridine-5-carboxymethylaminomethyl(34) synthesis GTPase MnmE [Ruminococcus sp.]|uniref:tRNA uridine-5-carboxymethylaminomethyl(34) synthesis GTPase MnmE n=1 Tax=Ruminococcus sp. TaxID=41978 RepID=UPI0025ED490B|nr:tRNA uridine-5-carboxymethylaminomethyl(34) synthesis GTPase MnmE [Ruminococcus sp.]MBR5683866.1 tRNA uridine-5-carboxymethylaminomethyl(34) synthesis GTPase MnmE [Ruminococcus sp.]